MSEWISRTAIECRVAAECWKEGDADYEDLDAAIEAIIRKNAPPSPEPEWRREFRCPKCGGSYFRSHFSGPVRDPNTITTIYCKDEFDRACRWFGVDEPKIWIEVAERSIPSQPTEKQEMKE